MDIGKHSLASAFVSSSSSSTNNHSKIGHSPLYSSRTANDIDGKVIKTIDTSELLPMQQTNLNQECLYPQVCYFVLSIILFLVIIWQQCLLIERANIYLTLTRRIFICLTILSTNLHTQTKNKKKFKCLSFTDVEIFSF